MLCELLYYNELSIVKTSKAFKRYARSYNIELTDLTDLSVQLTISKPSIQDLFKDLLGEIKGFKDQITLKLLKMFRFVLFIYQITDVDNR